MSPSATEKLHCMVATSAIYDGSRDDEDYTGECLPGTREKYLQQLSNWANKGPSERHVEWVSGVVGAGKTAMARSFCDILESKLRLPFASFFLWESDGKRNTLQHFPATIASQLARWIPDMAPSIELAINEDPFLLQSTFKKQMNKLVIAPLLNAHDAVSKMRHVIIVVDGLDECNLKGQQELLNYIPYFQSQLSSLPISLLLTSRPETQIAGAFNRPELDSITSRTTLAESDADILHYILTKLKIINAAFPYLAERYGKWPSNEAIQLMIVKSSGFFLWPTVALTYIETTGKGRRHNERLQLVLESSSVDPWVNNIDALYRAILKRHAPDAQDANFHLFKRRLALLCLPTHTIGFYLQFIFGYRPSDHIVDIAHIPVRAVFQETVEGIWDSVADLASIFRLGPNHLSRGGLLLPILSHRSFRDFAFNPRRCGNDFYYGCEQDLHTEVVCKLYDFFNADQGYKSTELASRILFQGTAELLSAHLKGASIKEELGVCVDNVCLDFIPPTWPFLFQTCMVGKLLDDVYPLLSNPEFPEGLRRQEVLLSKVTKFLGSRSTSADKLDIALFQLAASSDVDLKVTISVHSTYCWHVSRSLECRCLHVESSHHYASFYWKFLRESTIGQVAVGIVGRRDIAQSALEFLQSLLSTRETSERAIQLSTFIPVALDYWIRILLRHCPPNQDLYNALGPVCTAPLPDAPVREADKTKQLIEIFLIQTKAFNEYTERCRVAGIKTYFPSIKIPDEYWLSAGDILHEFGYEPHVQSTSTPGSPVTSTCSHIQEVHCDDQGASDHDIGGPTPCIPLQHISRVPSPEVLPFGPLHPSSTPAPASGPEDHTGPSNGPGPDRAGLRDFFKGLVCWP